MFVTGPHTGFEKDLVIELAQRDDINLVATSRKEGQLDYLDQYNHGQILKVILDVTKAEQVKTSIQQAMDKFGSIDVLVNNAGIGYFETFEESDLDEAKYMFDVNVWGLVDMMRNVLPIMRKQKSGIIVNFSSIGGLYSFPTLAFYHGTKYAVEGITESVIEEVKDLGIKTMIIEPSGFRTDWAPRSSQKTLPSQRDYAQFTDFIEGNAQGAHHAPGDPKNAAQIIIEQVMTNPNFFVKQFEAESEISLFADHPEEE